MPVYRNQGTPRQRLHCHRTAAHDHRLTDFRRMRLGEASQAWRSIRCCKSMPALATAQGIPSPSHGDTLRVHSLGSSWAPSDLTDSLGPGWLFLLWQAQPEQAGAEDLARDAGTIQRSTMLVSARSMGRGMQAVNWRPVLHLKKRRRDCIQQC